MGSSLPQSGKQSSAAAAGLTRRSRQNGLLRRYKIKA